MLAWSIGDGPADLWRIAEGDPMPEALKNALDTCLLSAYNAQFERLIFRHVLGVDLPPSRWQCTQVWAYSLAFSGRLKDITQRFNVEVHKDAEGDRLIHRFSKPQPACRKVRRWTHENDPEGWAKFQEYCKQDVVVEKALRAKLAPYPMPDHQWREYAIDQQINDLGVPIDTQLVNAALELFSREKKGLLAQMQHLTGLSNPNSGPQLSQWLGEQGVFTESLDKETVERLLSEIEDPLVNEVLRLKQKVSKTSVTKWKAFSEATCSDGRARGMFQFCGAGRTGRWAGRIVQLQNLARGGAETSDPVTAAEYMLSGDTKHLYQDQMALLSDTIRCAITAPDGMLLNVSDLGSIESRVLGWVSGCREINSTFEQKLDTYKQFAALLYRCPYDEVTKAQRKFCKPTVLGAGFGLGGGGLVKYAEGMGVSMTDNEAAMSIAIWREKHPEVPAFWRWCRDAVFTTTRTGAAVIGPHGLKTQAYGEFVFMHLPSGRRIAYYQPRIVQKLAPWGEMTDTFTFMGVDRYAMKWDRISAAPGMLCENIVQALARDVVAVWINRAIEAGFTVIGHVHDEVITLEKEDRIEELNELIRRPVPWAPDLLLDAAGFTTKRYRKD